MELQLLFMLKLIALLLLMRSSLCNPEFRKFSETGIYHCTDKRNAELDPATNLTKRCDTPHQCSPHYACLPSEEDRGEFVCCDPNLPHHRRKRENVNKCPKGWAPYYSYGSTKPLQCLTKNDCPQTVPYECKVSETNANVDICCIDAKGATVRDGPPVPPSSSNTGSSRSVNCPNATVGSQDEDMCDNGGEAYIEFLQTKPTKCTPIDSTCGSKSPVYKCMQQKSGYGLCCPDFGLCPGGAKPLDVKGQIYTACSYPNQKHVCSKDHSCTETAKGHVVCCPDVSQCFGGASPLFEPTTHKIVECRVGTDGKKSCPTFAPDFRQYECGKDMRVGSTLEICCPSKGACPEAWKPYVDPDKKTTLTCDLFDDRDDDCGPVSNGAVCLASTIGGTICCINVAQQHTNSGAPASEIIIENP